MMSFERALATNSFEPLGVKAMPSGSVPTWTVRITCGCPWLARITETVPLTALLT